MDAQRCTSARTGGRDGFALAATLLALIVIGAVVTGGFYVASQEGRVSTGHERAGRALHVAEEGMNRVLGIYGRRDYAEAPDDEFYEIDSGTVEAGGETVGSYVVDVRRLGPDVYVVRSQGEVLAGGATNAERRVARVVRVLDLDFPTDRAMQIQGGLEITGSAEISGEDLEPTGWDDCEPVGLQNAIVARDTSLVTRQGQGHEIIGDIAEDPDMQDSEFTDFGSMTYDDLAAMAEKIYPPGYGTISDVNPELTPNDECAVSAQHNWGAPLHPTHPCHGYFPIIHVQGDGETTISAGGAGQGILLVDGDLSMKGGFDFYGIVIVMGTLHTSGSGAHLNGMVMVRNGGNLDTNVATGNSIVNLSTCAVQRAVEYNSRIARAVPILERSWIDLSAATAGS